MDRSCKGGKDEGCCCSEQGAFLPLSLSGEAEVSGQSRDREGNCAGGSPGPAHYSSLLHLSAKSGADLQ